MVYEMFGQIANSKIDLSLLVDPVSYYNPANFTVAVATSLAIFTVSMLIYFFFFKISKQDVYRFLKIALLFTIADAALHLFIPHYEVAMPLYVISKFLASSLILIGTSRYTANAHILAIVTVVLLELRYYVLYAGREVFGLPFSVFNIIVHYLILYYLVEKYD